MTNVHASIRSSGFLLLSALMALLPAGCQSNQNKTAGSSCASASTKPAIIAPAPVQPTIRIKAGVTEPYTDSQGNVWLAEQGFEGGETVARDSDIQIANTKDPAMYRTEHFSMTSFSYPLPNGKYTVKLHFAETFEGITGPGQRVFSFNVQGREFKDFDIFAKAGGSLRPYIETVPVDITNGRLEIKFTSNIENPEINAIEIVPE